MGIDEALKVHLGSRAVLTASDDLGAFTQDWRGRHRGAAACVVMPSSTAEVAAIVRMCAAQGVPVLPQGGNTSLCGGAVPPPDGMAPVIVNLQRMRRIRAIDPVGNTMCVDAGCVLAAVQRAAEEVGRLYPVSLGAEGSCQIGGTISTNAGGTGVFRYGNTRENVLGLEVVLPDGAVWDGLSALRKNNTGYDLKHWFIGAEGTLGIVTGAMLRLHMLPTAQAMAWLAVPHPEAALEVLQRFRAACESRLSAFEIMNALQLQLVVEQVPGRRSPLTAPAPWHVLVELSDAGDQALLDSLLADTLEQVHGVGLVTDAVIAAGAAQRAALWEIRHSVSEANKRGGVGLTTDCAVPVSAVPTFIERATEAVQAIAPGLPVVVVAHAGDGNVHFIPFFPHAAWQGLAERERIASRLKSAVNDVAMVLGGTFSAEHGIGQVLTGEMAHYKSPVEIAAMQALKRALDPKGLFNPGRVLPAGVFAAVPHPRP